ncbi:MAG: lysostaphin resistance A-like protein [Chlorobiota bacterium]
MQKLLSKWWFRIIAILIPIVLMYLLNSIFPFGILANTLFFCFLITLVSVFIQYSRAGSNYNYFGLQLDRYTFPDLAKGLLLVLISNAIFIILGLVLGYEFEIHNNYYNLELDIVIFYLAFLFLMAFNEEIIFRGVIFQSLRERFGDISSIIIMSVLFSVVHLNNPDISNVAALNIVLAGILLSVMYITTESLWLPVSFHFFWNLNQQLVLGSDISGLSFDIELFRLTAINSQDSWLFGGAFGTEEGLLTTVIITLFTILSFKINKKNPFIMATKFKVKYEESKLLDL